MRISDHDEFVAALRDLSTALTMMTDVGYGSLDGATDRPTPPPAVDSTAMAEIVDQKRFAGVWDSNPVDTAATHIGLSIVAAGDAVRAFATMILADRTPLYAYQPVARFGIESAAMASQLAEPSIGTSERIRRSLNNRLISDYQRSRLPTEVASRSDLRERVLAAAPTLGVGKTTTKGKVPHLGDSPPTITRLIKDVLGNDRLGQVLYSHMSAVSHATIWGLVEVAEPDRSVKSPVVDAPLINSTSRISIAGLGLWFAYARATERVFDYQGWDRSDWNNVKVWALAMLSNYIETTR